MPEKDRERLRGLARLWMEISEGPRMEERKILWGRLHGLKGARPMVLIEPMYMRDFVKEGELSCEDPYMRRVERYMLENIVHAEELGDDIVVEPFFRIGWSMELPSFGLDIRKIKSENSDVAYVFEQAIKTPQDIEKLEKRDFIVDKDLTGRRKERLESIFGDILPVRVANYDFMDADEDGFYEWVGTCFFGLTWQLHQLLGLENIMYWFYDHPEGMHALMRYMVDDRLAMFGALEREGCLASNSDNQMAGPRFYGYCDDFPYFEGPAKMDRLWAWCESQESTCISAPMFEEFVLPYLKQLSDRFGMIYYGCCETVSDRLDIIKKAIPNMRAVSVSMWNDFDIVGDLIGKGLVYSRKPAPMYISGKNPDWDGVAKDIDLTIKSAKGCNLEFLMRDVYDIDGDRGRIARWVQEVRKRCDY